MKTVNKMIAIVGLGALVAHGAHADLVAEAAKLDVKKVCDVKANGLDAVLATAAKYNAEAKKLGIEFKRLGITNSIYVADTMKAVKAKQKETVLTYTSKKKTKTKKFPTEYAAWRACSFAVRALQQKHEAESTWRLAVPGDGYKY